MPSQSDVRTPTPGAPQAGAAQAPAAQALVEMILGFRTTQMVYVAAKLGIADLRQAAIN